MDARQKRRAAALKDGKCPGHPTTLAAPGRTMCQGCIDYQKRRREGLVAAGKCHIHKERNVVAGRTQCQDCLDRCKGSEHQTYNGVRRAKQFLAPYEAVDRHIVFERDNWICQHCGVTVNGDARADHVIPISLGGPHTYFNHQTLCTVCNGKKGNDIYKEPRVKHLVHLPIRKLIEVFAIEQRTTLPMVGGNLDVAL